MGGCAEVGVGCKDGQLDFCALLNASVSGRGVIMGLCYVWKWRWIFTFNNVCTSTVCAIILRQCTQKKSLAYASCYCFNKGLMLYVFTSVCQWWLLAMHSWIQTSESRGFVEIVCSIHRHPKQTLVAVMTASWEIDLCTVTLPVLKNKLFRRTSVRCHHTRV